MKTIKDLFLKIRWWSWTFTENEIEFRGTREKYKEMIEKRRWWEHKRYRFTEIK